MATSGSTYNQPVPEGTCKHRELLKEQEEAAKARRKRKGRGNGKRYCYDGRKGVWPAVQRTMTVLAGEKYPNKGER